MYKTLKGREKETNPCWLSIDYIRSIVYKSVYLKTYCAYCTLSMTTFLYECILVFPCLSMFVLYVFRGDFCCVKSRTGSLVVDRGTRCGFIEIISRLLCKHSGSDNSRQLNRFQVILIQYDID